MLPPGIHDATLLEVEQRFTGNSERKCLFAGFKKGIASLIRAGCKTVFLDGSFVTDKPIPGDFDACWDPVGVDPRKLDAVLLDFSHGRKNQKAKFGGEFFLSSGSADGSSTFVEFFQADRYTGKGKGIICIRFGDENEEREAL